MSVVYNGQAIIPAPFVTISSDRQEQDDGKALARKVGITLKGKLVAWKGSPKSDRSFWTSSGYPPDESIDADARLGAVLRKQEALTSLFATDGQTLEIQTPDGATAPRKFNPKILRVEFAEGNWFEYCEYTVSMEAEEVGPANVSEEWNIEVMDENIGTFRLSRNVSCKTKIRYDENGNIVNNDAWRVSRDHVLDTVGLGIKEEMMLASGVLNATGLSAFNYIRSQKVGERDGTFAVTETWVCYDTHSEPPAYNEYQVQTRETAGRTQVSIEGTVTGLELRNNTTGERLGTKWDAAQTKWVQNVKPNLFTAAVGIAAITLNPTPISYTEGKNSVAGTITYSYEFDDRPVNGDELSRTVRVTNNGAADGYAAVPVLGRPLGPVLQDLRTKTVKKRSVSISVQKRAKTAGGYVPTEPSTNLVVAAYTPSSSAGVFLDANETSWDEDSGQYSRQVAWTWE